jgi:hypothetical protein
VIGKVYGIPPQPHSERDTRMVPAGAVTFGVEYRDLDPEGLRATYAGNEAHLAELERESPEGGFTDEGVSIHVFDAEDGWEYVRFDVFEGEPHYHYVHRVPEGGEVVNNIIDFDTTAHGEMLPWVLERLRGRLPEMLRQAGGGELAGRLDPAELEPAIVEVGRLAEAAQAQLRSEAGSTSEA